jgi:hypothetical protein
VSLSVVYQCHALFRIHKIIKLFWDKMPCNAVKVNWRFGGTYHLHLQIWRVRRLFFVTVSCWFLLWLTLRYWTWRRYVSPKRRLTLPVYMVLSQKTELFTVTTLRISKPTNEVLLQNLLEQTEEIHETLQSRSTYGRRFRFGDLPNMKHEW